MSVIGKERAMIYLMRHGADSPERFGGWSSYGLTEKGKEQVNKAKIDLKNKGIVEIYSSDLTRARETAEIVGEHLCLPVELRPEFRETNNGHLAGMLKTEAAKKYPGKYFNTLGWDEPWPGGESPKMFFERIRKAWTGFKAEIGLKEVLLITHAGVINVILCLENNVVFTNKKLAYRIGEAEIIAVDNLDK